MDSETHMTPKPAALFRRMGSHLAMSLGISIGIALTIVAAVTLPKGLRMAARPVVPAVVPVPAAAPLDGKFIDRLSLADDEEGLSKRAFTPAILAMPMVATWPEAEQSAPASASQSTASTAPIRLRTAAANLAPLPPRRDPGLADGWPAGGPLRLTQALAEAPSDKQEEGDWSRIVTAPAGKVAEVVAGTAGLAQAAGSWTWSQASGLLPRW